MKHEEEINVKDVKMHKFSVCAYKSQDIAQSEKNFALSHNRETVTFRNSDFQLKKTSIGYKKAFGREVVNQDNQASYIGGDWRKATKSCCY